MLDSICARSNLEQESDSPCVFTLHHLTCLSESHKSGILPCVAFCMHVTLCHPSIYRSSLLAVYYANTRTICLLVVSIIMTDAGGRPALP